MCANDFYTDTDHIPSIVAFVVNDKIVLGLARADAVLVLALLDDIVHILHLVIEHGIAVTLQTRTDMSGCCINPCCREEGITLVDEQLYYHEYGMQDLRACRPRELPCGFASWAHGASGEGQILPPRFLSIS